MTNVLAISNYREEFRIDTSREDERSKKKRDSIATLEFPDIEVLQGERKGRRFFLIVDETHHTAPAAYEFQHRGLPHLHNVIIYVGPPTMAEEEMNKIVITMVSFLIFGIDIHSSSFSLIFIISVDRRQKILIDK